MDIRNSCDYRKMVPQMSKQIVINDRGFYLNRDTYCVPIMNNFSSLYFDVILHFPESHSYWYKRF